MLNARSLVWRTTEGAAAPPCGGSQAVTQSKASPFMLPQRLGYTHNLALELPTLAVCSAELSTNGFDGGFHRDRRLHVSQSPMLLTRRTAWRRAIPSESLGHISLAPLYPSHLLLDKPALVDRADILDAANEELACGCSTADLPT
jgi:hypothetical protein